MLGESDQPIPAYVQALLAQTAESLENLVIDVEARISKILDAKTPVGGRPLDPVVREKLSMIRISLDVLHPNLKTGKKQKLR